MRGILTRYAETGVPGELVEAAKRHELADAEFERNPSLGSRQRVVERTRRRRKGESRRGHRGHQTRHRRGRESRGQVLPGRSEFDHGHPETGAHRPARRHQGLRGRGTGDIRSHQAGAITCLGGGGPGPAQNSDRLHQGLRHDARERHSPHREDRSDHPYRVGARRREARFRARDPDRARGHIRRTQRSFLLRQRDPRPAGIPQGARRHRRQRNGRIRILLVRARRRLLARRRAARRERASSGAAREGLRGGEAPDLRVPRRQSQESRVPYLSCARHGAPARRGPGVAASHSRHSRQRHARRSALLLRGHRPARSHHPRGDRRRIGGGCKVRGREVVRRLARERSEARHDASAGDSQQAVVGFRGGFRRLCKTRCSSPSN